MPIAPTDATQLAHTVVLGMAGWLGGSCITWVTDFLDPQRTSVRTLLMTFLALERRAGKVSPE